MRKELENQRKVEASADDIWAVYSSPDLPKLIVKLLPSVFESIDIVEGTGGSVGTVLHLVYPPGSIPHTYKEKFITIDHEKRLKEVRQIQGGYLDMGVTFYMDSFHILENGPNSCIIKSMTTYEVPNEEVGEKVSPFISIDSLVGMAEAISKYVLDKKKSSAKAHHLCHCGFSSCFSWCRRAATI
uniref:Pathogenesis-related (PR)-10-related norcoclaurine synthase-like protein n=1 Tax=Eschscholzia californica TaxID=3467 RepID=C3SBS4_ESCCA|nr:pathogenesis-related (PR)-10-related norcoclaurine synthase-like protein [Eschscholzia californica]